MRTITSFVCQDCGYESPKFLGKCPECGVWNSLREFSSGARSGSARKGSRRETIKPQKISDISSNEFVSKRILTGFAEMDGVLGGGIVRGSVALLAGDPGIGKSTLLLQTGLNIADCGLNVLYLSGEESEDQIKMRAKRLSKKENIPLFLLSITNTDQAVEIIENSKPDLVIVDSIQTLESENLSGLSGSVGQVRYAAFSFIKAAKTLNIPVIIVGHVTKEGMVAGPMVLSHMVDTVLFLEGEKNTGTRILRSFKNRFGPVDEVGIFAMEGKGMVELSDIETVFMTKKKEAVSGSVLSVTMEGTRPFLVEIQALAVYSKIPMPRRVVSGVDRGRVELLLAVLQKHSRLPLDTMDVFINIAGGLKVSDPACDLGICLSVFSSVKNIPLSKTVGISEVGLLGELRQVPLFEKRVKQAQKLGFKDIITSEKYKYLNDIIRNFR